MGSSFLSSAEGTDVEVAVKVGVGGNVGIVPTGVAVDVDVGGEVGTVGTIVGVGVGG